MKHEEKTTIGRPVRPARSSLAIALGLALVVGCGTNEGEPTTPQSNPEPPGGAPGLAEASPGKDMQAAYAEFANNPSQAPLLLPSPSAILAGVEAATKDDGSVRLSRHVQRITPSSEPRRDQMAIRAGMLVADFFIYVHEKDTANSLALAAELLRVAEALEIPEEVRDSGRRLQGSLEAGDWNATRRHLNDVYGNLAIASGDDGSSVDKDTQLFILLGGWVEALHVVSMQLQSSYDEDLAELLHQDSVAKYLGSQLAARGGDIPNITSIRQLLGDLDEKLSAETVTKDQVGAVLEITNEIRSTV